MTENRRLRIAHIVLQPVLFWDDGTELTSGPDVQPITVPLSALASAGEGIAAEVERFQQQVDDQPGQ